MVERLKVAIEKARASRAGAAGAEGPPWPGAEDGARGAAPVAEAPPAGIGEAPGDPWLALEEIALDPRALLRERIVTRDKSDRAHSAFDALRTRLLKALADNRWTRVVVTSPSKSCGKTTVAANLAFSLARQAETRCMLFDFDLRVPQLARRLGQRTTYEIEPWLRGEMPPGAYLRRAGANLALGLNTVPVRNSAELLHSSRVAATLAAVRDLYRPHAMIFDTPPMLSNDDVLTLLPEVDGVLLVVGGGTTTPAEIEECERLMSGNTNFLGVVLNKAEGGRAPHYYSYEEP